MNINVEFYRDNKFVTSIEFETNLTNKYEIKQYIINRCSSILKTLDNCDCLINIEGRTITIEYKEGIIKIK